MLIWSAFFTLNYVKMIGNYKCNEVFEHTMSTVLKIKVQTLADPGFPVDGERQPCRGFANVQYTFCWKCMWKRKDWVPFAGGGGEER